MKIVVLDGYTLNPGDLAWAPLYALGDCRIHDRTPPNQVVERSVGVAAVLTNKTPVTAAHLAELPALKYIGVLATGFNIVDTAAAAARGIPVTNVPAYGTRSVAQMTFALILELTTRVGTHAASVREGGWSRCPDFSYTLAPLVELDGLTLGVVGLGRIGRAVCEVGRALGMRCVAAAPRLPEPSAAAGIEFLPVDELFSVSDVVSLHCPLTAETRNLVDAARLARMKPSAFLVNTSRGALIDESALAWALNDQRIAGAALDVLSVEPPPQDNPLLTARNCLVTPHMAWATKAARQRLLSTAVENLAAFQQGHPANVIN